MMEASAAQQISTYIEDVEIYLNEWTRAVRLRLDLLQSEHPRSTLTLKVTNNTDRNYEAVKVNALITGVRFRDLEGCRWPDLPAEPTPTSVERKLAGFFPGLLGLQESLIPDRYLPPSGALAIVQPIPSDFPYSVEKVQSPGGLLLEYPNVNLRPRQEVVLKSVPLLVLDEAGPTISIQWNATARNADGKLGGELTMTLEPSTLSTRALLDADS
jgi:hypothetical protein